MPASTIYPFRLALSLALRALVMSKGVLAINASLTSLMTAQGYASGQIPQFGDSSVVLGDLSPVSQATICIVEGGEQTQRIASDGYFYTTLMTQCQVKTAAIGDNAPEDFSMLGSVVVDNLRDLFSSEVYSHLLPTDPAGNLLLPTGLVFQDCYCLGARSMNFPNKEADGVTYTRGWIVTHVAGIAYTQNRPSTLGA